MARLETTDYGSVGFTIANPIARISPLKEGVHSVTAIAVTSLSGRSEVLPSLLSLVFNLEETGRGHSVADWKHYFKERI